MHPLASPLFFEQPFFGFSQSPRKNLGVIERARDHQRALNFQHSMLSLAAGRAPVIAVTPQCRCQRVDPPGGHKSTFYD